MNKKLTFTIKTLGCKVNQYESNSIYQQLKNINLEEASSTTADIWIINTCTVTAISDKKCRQMIKKAIKDNPSSLIVVTGCLAVNDAELLKNIPGVGLVLNNKEKESITTHILHKLNKPTPMTIDTFAKNYLYSRKKTRSFVKIQDGCQSFCTYCKIPYVRGKETSRNFEEIIAEITNLAEHNYKEIVLTGIHLGRYNYQTPRYGLAQLIEKINQIDKLSRIRLSSIAVLEFSDQLLDVVYRCPKVCPNFHISLQSGSTKILQQMNRNYSADVFKKIIDKIKEKIPEATFTTDVIIGFPGETDSCFKDTLAMMHYVKFHRVHLFPFSKREGTKAYHFSDTIAPDIIKERMKIISETTNLISKNHYQSLEGTQSSILLESKNKDSFWQGYTRNYEKILIKSPGLKNNQEIKVLIQKGKQDEAIAALIDN